MQRLGLLPRQLTQPTHGVAVHAGQAAGLAQTTTFNDVFKDRDNFLVGQPGVEKRRPSAFGEASLAGAAVKQSSPPVPAIAGADSQISGAAPAIVGALGILATKPR
jgi:hypothetical protein